MKIKTKIMAEGFVLRSLKGFTLIELLVVIAIIGLLATIVLVSLNSARTKAADAAVKGDMSTIMTQAEMVYDSNSYSYKAPTDACLDATVVKALAAAGTAGGGATKCNSIATAWAASSALKSGQFWCVDSTSTSKLEAAGLVAQTACP